jgi:hypothetical protein
VEKIRNSPVGMTAQDLRKRFNDAFNRVSNARQDSIDAAWVKELIGLVGDVIIWIEDHQDRESETQERLIESELHTKRY